MIHKITISQYYNQFLHIPIIDVRSPGEFQKGHIPHAHNIPLFNNSERAKVGTVYKQKSRNKAIELGYELVKPKLQLFVTSALSVAPDRVIAVHCWRGGMRSQSFAEHLQANGFNTIYVIEKGYKAFRNFVLSFFLRSFKLKILGGYTGSGKTDILRQLAKMGEQVIDLENLANHKGSAFGSIGEKEQPTVEHFENMLFHQLFKLDIAQNIWVEDESLNIGKIVIPKTFFEQMREQQLYFLDIPVVARAKYLVNTYGTFNPADLKTSILKISKRLGPQRTQKALDDLQANKLYQVAQTTLEYYDKAYMKGLSLRNPDKVTKIKSQQVDALINSQILLNQINK